MKILDQLAPNSRVWIYQSNHQKYQRDAEEEEKSREQDAKSSYLESADKQECIALFQKEFYEKTTNHWQDKNNFIISDQYYYRNESGGTPYFRWKLCLFYTDFRRSGN